MSDLEFLNHFREREAQPDISKANWYTVGAVALAAANAGDKVPALYDLAIEGTSLEVEKSVQRRLKEAILKTSPLYGIPRALKALLPLFQALPDDKIDKFGHRWESRDSEEAREVRRQRGRKYFDKFWTPGPAQSSRDLLFKYQPDLYLMCQEYPYEWIFSDNTILNPVESQLCNVAALICSDSPRQALWHIRGVLRHEGTIEDAKFAQDLAIAVLKELEMKIEPMTMVEQIDFESTEL